MTVIPFPLSLLVKAVDMVSSTSKRPLSITGTYTLSSPLFTPRIHTAPNTWTLSLHDITHSMCDSHPRWGVFSFGTFKGIIMVNLIETPASASAAASPPTSETDSELEEGEIRELPVLAPTAKPDAEQTFAYPLCSHIWEPGQRIHFRWRGSRDPVAASSYSNEDLSPRKRRRFAPVEGSATMPTVAPAVPAPLFGGIIRTGSSIPRNPSWAGSGEIVFLDNDTFELVFRNQGEVWELDGRRVGGGDGLDEVEGLASGAIVDGYGKGWYEFFWLADRRGDWRGDVDAELLEKTP